MERLWAVYLTQSALDAQMRVGRARGRTCRSVTTIQRGKGEGGEPWLQRLKVGHSPGHHEISDAAGSGGGHTCGGGGMSGAAAQGAG
jgi:hypothetical protein